MKRFTNHENVFFILVISSCLIASSISSLPRDDEVTFHLRNDGCKQIDISWVNRKDGSTVSIGILEPFGSIKMNTFLGHEFQLLELPQPSTNKCTKRQSTTQHKQNVQVDDNGCQRNSLSVEPRKSQKFLVTDGLHIVDDLFQQSLDSWEKSKEDIRTKLNMCRAEARNRLEKATNHGCASDDTLDWIVQHFEECVALRSAPYLNDIKNEIQFEESIRTTVASFNENYTCHSEAIESTPDVDIQHWNYVKENVTRVVHRKFVRPEAQIHVVEKFASAEECSAMESSVEGHLGRATTADGKGGFQLNQNRKALQAPIQPDWSQEDTDKANPVLRINRRIFDYTNHVLNMSISVDGQEPLMSIQYFGGNLTEPDRYNSHCDGKCEGTAHRYAARMATMVVYCEVPILGGKTNFQNSDVTIQPSKYDALFFSYIDPTTMTTDRGYSQHSGCPVYEGEKKIITQWVRFGVSKELTADDYNSLDILIAEDGE